MFLLRGANWARVLLIAGAVLGLLRMVLTVAQHQPAMFVVANAIDGAVLLVAVACLLSPATNAFLARPASARPTR